MGVRTNLMQVLPPLKRTRWETPTPILSFDTQVQCPVQLPIQSLLVVRLIRLCDSTQRLLYLPLLLLPSLLRFPIFSFDCPYLPILHQSFHDGARLTEFIPDQQLIIPSLGAVRTIPPKLACRLPVAFPGLDLPVCVRRRVFLEVEITGERHDKSLIETLLVEEEGLLERGRGPGKEGRARKENSGLGYVFGGPGVGSYGREVAWAGNLRSIKRFEGRRLSSIGSLGWSRDVVDAVGADPGVSRGSYIRLISSIPGREMRDIRIKEAAAWLPLLLAVMFARNQFPSLLPE